MPFSPPPWITRYADLAVTAVRPDQYPVVSMPEVALVGRSNVGKSSFINKMVARNGLARTSSAPGKTRVINFYDIGHLLYLVDLPGYGFAKVAKTEQAKWAGMIESYLLSRPSLSLVIQLVDIRHPPSREDREMQLWLRKIGLPTQVIATKTDKIGRSYWVRHVAQIRKDLGMNTQVEIPLFSAETGYGAEQILEMIVAATGLEVGERAVVGEQSKERNAGNQT